MKIITNKIPHRIVADDGKLLRDKNDVYTPATTDENGNEIAEHIPYTTDVIFLPSSITEEKAKELYVEE